MTEWTEKWPTEPGRYWFWGRDRDGQIIQLHMVEVHKTGNGVDYIVVYIAPGLSTCFVNLYVHLYRMEKGAKGVWCPVVVPEPPHSEGGK